jgi:hypothetical protein
VLEIPHSLPSCFLLRNLLLFLWVYLYMLFGFFLSYSLQYSFSVLCNCFNDNMLWRGLILVKSVWCLRGFLYLNGQNFLEIYEIFCYYFIEYTTYTFGLDLFSFSMPMILRFGLLMESVSSRIFLSQVFSCLTNNSSVFFFNFYFIFKF